jgi:hypothetical protein
MALRRLLVTWIGHADLTAMAGELPEKERSRVLDALKSKIDSSRHRARTCNLRFRSSAFRQALTCCGARTYGFKSLCRLHLEAVFAFASFGYFHLRDG